MELQSPSAELLASLETLYKGGSLDQQSCKTIFSQVVKGEVDNIVLSSLLTALKSFNVNLTI